MGGFLGIGGSSAKTDRSGELAGWNSLQKLYSWALPTAQSATGAGLSALGNAGQYFKNIVSGNRSQISQAVAPETAAARSQSDASARQLAASGTARGGGVASTNQQRDQQLRAQVDQAIFGARPAAAQAESQVGATEAGVGMGTSQIGGQAAASQVQTAIESRKTDLQNQQQLGQAVGQMLMFAAMAA